MIVEQRIYTLQPGGAREYIQLYEDHGLEVQTRILGNLMGCYQTECGVLNQIVFQWAYENLADRAQRRAALLGDAKFGNFRAKSRHLLQRQENCLLLPAPFMQKLAKAKDCSLGIAQGIDDRQ
jgi:hypothetical protein